MEYRRMTKISKHGDSLMLVIPAIACRDLNIARGDYFDLVISDPNIIVARRLKISPAGGLGEARDPSVPLIKYGKRRPKNSR